MARQKRVLLRLRLGSTEVVSPRDLVTFGSQDVDLASVYRDAPETISPYAFDFARREVMFVVTDASVDLAKAHPFFYEAQRIHAVGTIHASFDEVADVAASLDVPSHRFAFLYSPGRCGSTIAGRIAGRLPGVQDLSEPDFYSQAALERDPSFRTGDAELVRLVAATTRLLASHRMAIEPECPTILVKQRGAALYAAEVVRDAVPRSRAMFLHRNAADVVNSYIGAFLASPFVALGRALGIDRLAVRVLRTIWPRLRPEVVRHMPLVIEPGTPDRDSHGVVELLAIGFHSMWEEAARLERSGSLRFASVLRYEDLASAPEHFVRGLAEGLGVSLDDPKVVAHALEATRTNVQAGSSVASDGVRSLTARDVAKVEHTIAQFSGRLLPSGGVA